MAQGEVRRVEMPAARRPQLARAAAVSEDEDYENAYQPQWIDFLRWQQQVNKSYASHQEALMRFKVWGRNVERIKVSFLRETDAYDLIVRPVPHVFDEVGFEMFFKINTKVFYRLKSNSIQKMQAIFLIDNKFSFLLFYLYTKKLSGVTNPLTIASPKP